MSVPHSIPVIVPKLHLAVGNFYFKKKVEENKQTNKKQEKNKSELNKKIQARTFPVFT